MPFRDYFISVKFAYHLYPLRINIGAHAIAPCNLGQSSVAYDELFLLMRPVIYQLFVRHFSNPCTTGQHNGSKEQNGCGSFHDINDKALESLARFGATHIWLTGVLRHSTQTSYPNLPASPSCVVKGIAGSPYAVSDYFDLDPDLAINPEARLEEFQALLKRIRRWGMVPMMDFIPNHVSRDYKSTIKPDHSFGRHDQKHDFFERNNAFYYLNGHYTDGILRLPQGEYEPERHQGRVTGNNAQTWSPSEHDWYETVKLNYGANYHYGADACRHLPPALSSVYAVPRTWRLMDEVLAYWQTMGVGGFRCDMAHMVPIPFWSWLSSRCSLRDESCLLLAEAYNDHMKMSEGDVHEALLAAGFQAVYDSRPYEYLRAIYEGVRWANDLDACHDSHSAMFSRGVRYLENHDEPRVCAAQNWGGVGETILPAISLAQFASSAGPVLFYNGQEFGERAEGPSGFGGDCGRTSIFDYTSLPRMQSWLNNGRYNDEKLSQTQIERREWMGQLLCLLQDPAFAQGEFYGLNWSNIETPNFGRVEDEDKSGHHFYAFLRHHRKTKRSFLVLCNLSPNQDIKSLGIHIPENARQWASKGERSQCFKPILFCGESILLPEVISIESAQLSSTGLPVLLPAGTGLVFEWL